MNKEILEEIRQVSKDYPDGIHKRSEAQEMFEKLGYSLRDKNEYITESQIIYDKGNSFCSIYFDFDKTIDTSGRIIDLDLLQAINKQVEELGWVNDNSRFIK